MINLLQMGWIIWNCWLREKWQKVNYLFFSFIWSRTCFVCKSRVRSLVLFNFNLMFHWWYLVYLGYGILIFWVVIFRLFRLSCLDSWNSDIMSVWVVMICLSRLWCADYSDCDVLTTQVVISWLWIVMSCLSGLGYHDYSGCYDLSIQYVMCWLFGLWCLDYPGYDVLTIWIAMSCLSGLWYRDYSGWDDLSIQTVMSWLFGLWCLDLLGCYVMSVWVVMFCDVCFGYFWVVVQFFCLVDLLRNRPKMSQAKTCMFEWIDDDTFLE